MNVLNGTGKTARHNKKGRMNGQIKTNPVGANVLERNGVIFCGWVNYLEQVAVLVPHFPALVALAGHLRLVVCSHPAVLPYEAQRLWFLD
ncbi:MAG: hypothetical protein V3V02_10685 [Rhizobiaceae bacterium]